MVGRPSKGDDSIQTPMRRLANEIRRQRQRRRARLKRRRRWREAAWLSRAWCLSDEEMAPCYLCLCSSVKGLIWQSTIDLDQLPASWIIVLLVKEKLKFVHFYYVSAPCYLFVICLPGFCVTVSFTYSILYVIPSMFERVQLSMTVIGNWHTLLAFNINIESTAAKPPWRFQIFTAVAGAAARSKQEPPEACVVRCWICHLVMIYKTITTNCLPLSLSLSLPLGLSVPLSLTRSLNRQHLSSILHLRPTNNEHVDDDDQHPNRKKAGEHEKI